MQCAADRCKQGTRPCNRQACIQPTPDPRMAAALTLAALPRAAIDYLVNEASPTHVSIAGAVVLLTLVLVAGALFGLVAALATAFALLLACMGATLLIIARGYPPQDLED